MSVREVLTAYDGCLKVMMKVFCVKKLPIGGTSAILRFDYQVYNVSAN